MSGKYSLVKVMEKRNETTFLAPKEIDVCVIGPRDVIYIQPFFSFQDIARFVNGHSESIYMVQDEEGNTLNMEEFERLCRIIEQRGVMRAVDK